MRVGSSVDYKLPATAKVISMTKELIFIVEIVSFGQSK
ncbi:hypothetical protein BH10PSE19_BH10PSE19_02860 [soil metagenome]